MGKYFGTDGFRGEANVALTAAHAHRLGRFLGWYDRTHHAPSRGILIGRDTRRSGEMLACALAAGITASGTDVYLLGVTTTPSVAYLAREEGFASAVMISASHNPHMDNGIKLIGGDGGKLEGEVIASAEEYLDGCVTWEGVGYTELPYATRADIGRVMDFTAARARYAEHLVSSMSVRLDGMRIGLDCAHGSTYEVAGRVLTQCGAEVEAIGVAPDGLNINDGVGSTHPARLQRLVRERGLDAGFAFDGDGDRCIAVDETGAVVDGDGILYLSARSMKKHGALVLNTVVGTVMTNSGTELSLAREGISLCRTPVGDRYVWREMERHGYCLGGESSGHIIYAGYASTGDGVLTALRVLEVMRSEGARLSALVQDMTVYPQLLENVEVPSPREVVSSPVVMEAVCRAEQMLEGRGRVLVRASGTEPVVRVMCEAETRSLCRTVSQFLIASVGRAAKEE